MNRRLAAILLASQCCALLACRADRSTSTGVVSRVDCLDACRSTLTRPQRTVERIRIDAISAPSARFSGALSGTVVPRAVTLARPASGSLLRLDPNPAHDPLPNPEYVGLQLRLDTPLDAKTVSGIFVRARASYELTNAWVGFGSSVEAAGGPDMSVEEFRFTNDAGAAVAEVALVGHPKWTGEIGYIGFGFRSHGRTPLEILDVGVVRTLEPGRPAETNGSGVIHSAGKSESRAVVRALAPSSCTCDATIPTGAVLDVTFGASGAPSAAETRGVTFCVSVETDAGRSVVWSQHVNPSLTGSGQQWQTAKIPVDGFGGKNARIHFDTFDGTRCAAIGEPSGYQTTWVNLGLGASPDATRTRPSVVLISLDTLRADRLGCYGADRQTSPAIDAMAADGVVFEQAISQAPETHASHMSLFTGLYPTEHRVQRQSDVLSGDLPFLVESFRNAGYRTAAVTEGGFVAAHYGFDRGFQSYRESDSDASRRELVGRTFSHANAWLERVAGQQFFLFVHTYEVHPPFDPPDDLVTRFAGDYHGEISAPFPVMMNPSHEQLLRNSRFAPDDLTFIRNLYDAGVRNADDHVATLLATLRRLNVLDSTVVVLLSDHGEELADHFAIPQHGHTLYDELVRVPLIMQGPGLRARSRIRDQVQLIDVLPTLLDLVNVSFDRDSVSGHSVAPALRGEPMEPRPAFSASVSPTERLGVRIRVDGTTYKLVRTPGFQESEWIGQVRELADLSQLRDIPAEVELFDLDADPHEHTNIAATRPEVAARLGEVLADYMKRHNPARASRTLGIPPDVAERLRALGYVPAQ